MRKCGSACVDLNALMIEESTYAFGTSWACYLRPVVSLSVDVNFTGSGTVADPYMF